MKVELQIQNKSERDVVVAALASNGYTVRVITQTKPGIIDSRHFVEVETEREED